MAALRSMKKEVRQNINAILANLSSEDVANQSRNAVTGLLSMPEYRAAKRISVYLSMPTREIETRLVVHDAFNLGKRVFVPYIHKQSSPAEGQPKSIIDMLELRSAEEYESLGRDGWGIPTLPMDSVTSRPNCFGGEGLSEGSSVGMGENDGLDLIVMPGSVFDMHMGRVGHGKGFYDFFLQRYKENDDRGPRNGMPFLVGFALNEQILSSDQTVPRNASDWQLDALLSGHGRLLRGSQSTEIP